MTRQRAKELLPVIQAHAEGKTIEARAMRNGVMGPWVAVNEPDWHDDVEHRIKPEPRDFWIYECGAQTLATTFPPISPLYPVIHVREVLE